MLSLFLIFFTVILSSALISMTEAALLSLPIMRARLLHQENRKNSKVLLDIKEDIHITIASIVIVNNAINIMGSIFIGQRVDAIFGGQWLGFVAVVITFLIIVFGEVIPKTIGERYKIVLSLFFAKPVKLLVWVLRPLVKLILKLERPFTKNLHSPMPKVTEEEIKMMLKLAREEGTVEIDEHVLCTRVFKLNDLKAAQIMRPIEQIHALPAYKTLEEVKEAIINSKVSRIAVYNKDPLDIVGMVQHRILLREIAKDNYKAYVKDFMAQPVFVNSATPADALLEKFQAYRQHLFIVQDSAGKNIGLVTMEDVLEELFGEIFDEKDVPKP